MIAYPVRHVAWWRWALTFGVTDGMRRWDISVVPFVWKIKHSKPGTQAMAVNDRSQIVERASRYVAVGPFRFTGPFGYVDYSTYCDLVWPGWRDQEGVQE